MALRIRKDIDLKELEKYGMKYNSGSDCYVEDYAYNMLTVYTDTPSREIIIEILPPSFGDFEGQQKAYNNATNILYNLIKDGLVEQFNDKKED